MKLLIIYVRRTLNDSIFSQLSIVVTEFLLES